MLNHTPNSFNSPCDRDKYTGSWNGFSAGPRMTRGHWTTTQSHPNLELGPSQFSIPWRLCEHLFIPGRNMSNQQFLFLDSAEFYSYRIMYRMKPAIKPMFKTLLVLTNITPRLKSARMFVPLLRLKVGYIQRQLIVGMVLGDV